LEKIKMENWQNAKGKNQGVEVSTQF